MTQVGKLEKIAEDYLLHQKIPSFVFIFFNFTSTLIYTTMKAIY